MRVLVSHEAFEGFGGTETYMLAVAEQLQRTGHRTSIYSPKLGPMADVARARGVHVISNSELPESCDLILAQDAATCLDLWLRYPGSIRVFVGHSDLHMLQCPPQLEGACQALVVLNDRMLGWARSLAWAPRIERLRQPVDLDRFRLPPTRSEGPPRLLVLSNYGFGTRERLVTDACRAAGVPLRWIGGQRGQTANPEAEIAAADAVVGLGRSVLDAMAASRAALILGPVGGDGWVTPENYERMEADGFTGRGSDRMLDGAALVDELSRWDPAMGNDNRDLVARHHDVHGHVAALIALARGLGPHELNGNSVEQELARLVRLEWQRSGALISARAEMSPLRTQLDQVQRDAERMSEFHVAARENSERRLADVLATRRWRIAVALSKPVDRLRRWPRAAIAATAARFKQ
jgi:hypothetical protein